MRSAIFLSWDDWGGFYDHVIPPKVDQNGYGLRAPDLVIGPYARQGFIDHQTLSFDAYLKFIEDDFLGGSRLDPKTDGRSDPRPDVRENASFRQSSQRFRFHAGAAPASNPVNASCTWPGLTPSINSLVSSLAATRRVS
jgi:phospholipase C